MSEKDIGELEDISAGYLGSQEATYPQKEVSQISTNSLPNSVQVETVQFETNNVPLSTSLNQVTLTNESIIMPSTIKGQEGVEYHPIYSPGLEENPMIENHSVRVETQEEMQKNQPPIEMTSTNEENGVTFDLSQESKHSADRVEDSQQHFENESNSLNTLNEVDLSVTDSSAVNSPEVKKVRNRWTPEETNALINGCFEHGVGAWKKILDDSKYSFVNRTSVDLKDRFRTLFPEEYHRLYHTSMQKLREIKKQPVESYPTPFRRVDRRPKRKFNQEDDENLKAGFQKYGCAWARIVKDPTLNLQDRRSTDLRDRFRTAFPEIYEQLGYAPKYPTKLLRSQPNDEASDSSQVTDPANTPNSYVETSVFHGLETHPLPSMPRTPDQNRVLGVSNEGPLTPPPTKRRKKKNIPIRPEHEETVESVYGKVIDAQLKEGIESDVWSSNNSDQYVGTFSRVVSSTPTSNDQDQYRKILPKQ
ncbi:hypothetical protein K7432_000498 [Basidiobolus ranarum]|uniref:Uncharacterized protein n=1 Tax=Basidiobolus ranarum TaxID=34480 RepID=A0ABR2X4I9_9FUNG